MSSDNWLKPFPSFPCHPRLLRFSTFPREEPMQLDRARLSLAQCLQKLQAGECIYCGQTGHFLAACLNRPKEEARL